MKDEQNNFFIQQLEGSNMMSHLLDSLTKTGKLVLDVPPDCFIWKGTQEELEKLMQQSLNNYEQQKPTNRRTTTHQQQNGPSGA